MRHTAWHRELLWRGPRAPRSAFARRAAAVLLAALLAAPAAWGEKDASSNEVKANFVFQVLKYVTWPESAVPAASPFVVGVIGDEALAAALRDVVTGEQAQGRAVEVKTLAEGTSAGIHLLFLGRGGPSDLREFARQYHGAPVLTVADRFEFAQLGGDLGIELVGGRVSFSINRRKAIRGDFVISSKLMRLASEVK
jgi:YfiR/HmsC-like